MKTDSIFFEIFQKFPQILFEILGEPPENGENYEFKSVEVKQTAFRIDGVFLPKVDASDQTVIFVEVQFQKDEGLYDRFFSEIMMYLAQNPDVEDWRAVAIFPRPSKTPDNQYRHRALLRSPQFQAIYLEEFLGLSSDQLGLKLMQLIVSKKQDTEPYLQSIVQQVQTKTDPQNQAIIEVVSTIMVYKFPQLTRKEIQAMFTVSDLKKTKVYQEALDEGRVEGREIGLAEGRIEGQLEGRLEESKNWVVRILKNRFDSISTATELDIRSLTPEKLEQLSEAIFEFSDRTDLETWLDQML